MNRDPEKLRHELADLANDQADTAEMRTLTDAERRGFEQRQERINELCDELQRLAARTHTDAVPEDIDRVKGTITEHRSA